MLLISTYSCFNCYLSALFADKVLTLPRELTVAELPGVLKAPWDLLLVANPDWVKLPGRGGQVSLGKHGLVRSAVGPTRLLTWYTYIKHILRYDLQEGAIKLQLATLFGQLLTNLVSRVPQSHLLTY